MVLPVNFEIEEHKKLVMIGESGSGKTTFGRLVNGLIPCYYEGKLTGSVMVNGNDTTQLQLHELAGTVGSVFQNPKSQFYTLLTDTEVIFACENIGMEKREILRRFTETVQDFRLEKLLGKNVSQLSGGEKQKAALSCLYVMESRCILLDESFANLDHEAAAQLLEMLLRMKTSGRTILAIDHKADLWLEAADEIVLLEEGGKVAARGINCKNLPEHRTDFERLGLFYPGSRPERAARPVAEGKPLLQFRGVSIRKGLPTRRKWGRTVYDAPFLVQNADADFPVGCMTAVLGPSGTGKTTTFLSVLKQHPYTGQILFQGRDIAKMKPKELYRHIGIVFQNPANQFVTQNVEDEVCVGLRLWEPGLSDEAYRQRAEELLDRYGLKRQRRYSPYMLSQGQQRRLAVLSVLAGGQELLLLDEPTYGQDARSVNAIMEHLREKVEQEGLTVIFITHDTELAAAWADQIYRLEDTALVEKSAEEVL